MKKLKLMVGLVALLFGAVAPRAHATNDGTPSTGSFTISSVSPLAAASATGTITVLDTSSLLGAYVTVGAYQFKAGRDFAVGTTTNATAASLAAAINAVGPLPVSAAAVATNVVSLTADDVGAWQNAITLRTSNTGEMTVSGTTLAGGQNNAYITINGIRLTQGAEWFIQDVSSNTAINLAAAINHKAGLQPLLEAMPNVPSAGVVFLRATLTPAAYPLATSDSTDLAASGAAMTGGASGNISRFTCNLGYVNALPTSGYPAGCTAYLISDPTHLQLSTQTVVGTQSWLAK